MPTEPVASSGPSLTARGRADATGGSPVHQTVPVLFPLGVAALAAVLRAAGSALPVVEGAEPGFTSAPLLVALAVLPVGLALGLALTGRRVVAAGVLAGLGVLVPGGIVLDLQFFVDASLAARPELYLPTSVATPSPAAGLWLLLAGNVLLGVAAALAMWTIRRRPELDEGPPEVGRRRWLPVAVCVGVVASVGLLMAPFTSDDLYILGRGAFEGPTLMLAGYLLLACALPLAAAVGVSSGVTGLARGVLFGLAMGVAAIALPSLFSWQVPVLSGSAGPVLVLVAAVGLGALGCTRFAAGERAEDSGDEAGEATVPGLGRLQFVTGVFGLLTAAAAVAGSLTRQVESFAGFPAPDSPAWLFLLVAGVLVGVLGLGLFVPRLAALVRPAMSAAWAGVVLTGTAVLDTSVTVAGLPSGTAVLGRGVLWVSVALFLAAVTGCCSAVAGIVEREDSGHGTDPGATTAGATLTAPLVAAGLLAVGAFGMPVVEAPDYVPAGLWSDLATPTFGLVAALLTVLGCVALAPRSRPARAAALLTGAACLLGLRAAELPLTGAELEGATAGPGLWIAVAAALALLLAAGLALTGNRERT